MTGYMLETFFAGRDAAGRDGLLRRMKSAARHLRRAGCHIRVERSIHLPDDQMCLYLLEAGDADDVRRLADRAGLETCRVVLAVSSRGEDQSC